MAEPVYNPNAFAFTDGIPLQVWQNIIIVLDQNIKVETELAIGASIDGEKRIHQCGRANAIREIKEILVSERKKALDVANIDWTKDETLK